MKTKVVSLTVATILSVMAGAFAPAVTASVTISDSNVTVIPYKMGKGTGTVTGAGTEMNYGENQYYSGYDVSMSKNYAHVDPYINDGVTPNIGADDFSWAHFKFAISESQNFVLQFGVRYTNTSGSNNANTVLFNMSDHMSVGGTQQAPKDYTADMLFDLTEKKAYIYFNGIIKDEAVEADIPNLSYLRELRFINSSGVAHSYKVSGLLLEAFPKGATLDDVLGYLTDSYAPVDYVKGAYFDGINTVSESDDISHGSLYINGSNCGVSGDNTDGYTLTDTADGGFYRYFFFDNKDSNGAGMPAQEDDSVVRHSVSICPKSGDKTVCVGKYSTQEETLLLYFDAGSAEIRDKNGNTVLEGYDEDAFYQVDFFFNNNDYEYRLYLDNKEVFSGTLEHTPVGYISYKNGAAGACMILKNIFTKIYAMGTSMNSVTGDLYGVAYIEIQDLTVLRTETGDYEISAAAVFNNISKTYANARIIYALCKNSELIDAGGGAVSEQVPVTNDEISMDYSEIGRKYPYGLMKTDGVEIARGDVLSVKAWLVAGDDSQTHLIDSNEASFTAE